MEGCIHEKTRIAKRKSKFTFEEDVKDTHMASGIV